MPANLLSVPTFTMGNGIRDDWYRGTQGVVNALGAMHQRDFQQQQIAQQQAQWEASNALAKGRFGLEQQKFAQEQQMAPLQLERMRADIERMRREGATQAQMMPYQMLLMKSQAELAQANARAALTKDPQREFEAAIYRRMLQNMNGGAGQQGAPQMRPQAMPGGNAPMTPIPMGGLSGPPPDQSQMRPTPVVDGGPQMQPTPVADQSGPPMINVPGMGPMLQSDAEAMRFLDPKERAKVLGETLNAARLEKGARTELDKKELNTSESLARLNAIADTYKPEFLTWKTQFQQGAMWLKAKATGNLTPEQRQQRMAYETFKSSTLTNLNAYIKEITGAAMTDGEARRITATMPNMDDDPTAFEAKLNQVRLQSALAIARYRYLRSDGFKGQPWDVRRAESQMPLQKMHDTIRGRAGELMQQIRQAAPGMNKQELYQAVKQRVRSEFGFDV